MYAKILLLALGAQATELNSDNWDDETTGKTVFIKFLAPWWGHCKSMKPAWDKLMKEYQDSTTVLVADVDCTADGKDLCEEHGIQGFPTIKYGDPSGLEDYEGGRGFDELKKFAADNLKPTCSPSNIDLCDAAMKKTIAEYQTMDMTKLAELIDGKESEMKDAESEFESEVEKLQERYDELSKAKDAKMKEIKDSGLGVMKAVRATRKKTEGDASEL